MKGGCRGVEGSLATNTRTPSRLRRFGCFFIFIFKPTGSRNRLKLSGRNNEEPLDTFDARLDRLPLRGNGELVSSPLFNSKLSILLGMCCVFFLHAMSRLNAEIQREETSKQTNKQTTATKQNNGPRADYARTHARARVFKVPVSGGVGKSPRR